MPGTLSGTLSAGRRVSPLRGYPSLPDPSLRNREDALLFSIAFQVAGGAATFRVQGHPLEREGELVGHLRMNRAELLAIAHALASVARSPVDLAILFELAGSEVQEMTGEILGQEILGEEDETSGSLSPR